MKVPSKNGSASGGDGNDYDVLSDVVMDDSRTASAAPSRQVSWLFAAYPWPLGLSAMFKQTRDQRGAMLTQDNPL